MKIIVNSIPLAGLQTGIGRCVRNLYQALEARADVQPFYFAGKKLSTVMPAPAASGQWARRTSLIWRLPDPVVFMLRSLIWLLFEHRFNRLCRRRNFDLYHETAFVPAAVSSLPVVFSLYDLSLIRYREKHPKERVWFFDFFFKRRLPYADHILTISEFVRSEILDELKVSPAKVTAVPLAADPVFFRRPAGQVDRVLKQWGWPRHYLLFVGSLEPRKNLAGLVQALKRSRTKIPLILTGWQGWGEKSWQAQLRHSDLAKRVIFTGYVDDDTLGCLYSGATALIYPSFYEGFGLPVLEAMACGCPVLCSRAASLPEVAGEAALYLDPHDIDAMADAIDLLLDDAPLQARMREQGFERAATFNWERTARETLDVFQRVAGESH
jgi:alpha-1,3-rhamnosyl/mannosyltransferase